MGKVSEKTVTFLYRVFMAVLSIGAFLLCLPDYIGIKKATIVKVAGFLAVILVMALMQSFRGKLRLYGAGVLLAFGMLVVGITGVSESVELVEGFFSWLFAQEGWQVEATAYYQFILVVAITVAGYFLQSLMEKYPHLKEAAAFLLAGYYCFCVFEERRILRAGIALGITFILITFVEWTRQHFHKMKRGSLKAYMLWVMPFLGLYLFLLLLMPAPESPYSWQWVETLWQRAQEKLTVLTENIICIGQEDMGTAVSGFSDKGQLLGGLRRNKEPVLLLEGKTGLITNVYLIGKVFDQFDGQGWQGENESTDEERLLDALETAYAVERYDPDNTTDYIRRIEIGIRYRYFHTEYLLAPLKTTEIRGFEGRNVFAQRGDDIVFKKRKGYGTEYQLDFYQLNVAHPNFQKLMDEKLQEDTAAWNRVVRSLDLQNSEYPIEMLYAHQRSIKEQYAEKPEISPEVAAWFANITGGGESDLERLRCLEQALQAYEYTLTPGELPEYVTGEREFLDYFLLESRKGYCSYFATAFVLLAREAGFPARYVQGFCIPIENTKETMVYSGMAHAWPEVYVEGIGWIPFEPTPGYEEIRNRTWEKKDQNAFQQIGQELPFTEEEWEKELSDLSVPNEQKEKKPYVEGRKIFLILGYFGAILLFGGGLILIVDFLLERHRDRNRTVEKKFCILVYGNLQILSLLGIKREEGETFHELKQRAGKLFQDKSCSPIHFLEQYEKYLYGNEKPGVKELMEVQEERQELLSGLKEQKGRFYPYYRLRLFFYRGNS